MAIIPNNQQIRTIDASVDMTERGSKLINDKSQVYTTQDLKETVGAVGIAVLKLTQESTNEPVITVLYNNTGFTFESERTGIGEYRVTAKGLDFSKTTSNIFNFLDVDIDFRCVTAGNSFRIKSFTGGNVADSLLQDAVLEIKVYA